jgi:hypothetical protein
MIEQEAEPTVEQVKEKLNETLTWLKEFHEWGLGDTESNPHNEEGETIVFSGSFPPPPPPPELL